MGYHYGQRWAFCCGHIQGVCFINYIIHYFDHMNFYLTTSSYTTSSSTTTSSTTLTVSTSTSQPHLIPPHPPSILHLTLLNTNKSITTTPLPYPQPRPSLTPRADIVCNKTFHRYIVRAKRGTAQSLRDASGNAPKSAGASLRRHNESMLTNVCRGGERISSNIS